MSSRTSTIAALDLARLVGDLVGEVGDAAVTQHVGEALFDGCERELDRVADRKFVDAHHSVRAGRLLDVVVVRLVLEAVEAQVLEPVGGPAHVERGTEVVEGDVGLDDVLVERALDDLVGQAARLHDELYRARVDGDAVLGDHRDRQLVEPVAAPVRGFLTVDRHHVLLTIGRSLLAGRPARSRSLPALADHSRR